MFDIELVTKIEQEKFMEILLEHFDKNLELEDKVQLTIPSLDLQQTFWLIASLTPSKSIEMMGYATNEQHELLQLVKSARHPELISIISDAFTRAD